MMYLLLNTPPSAIFFLHMSTGGALNSIFYFELLLSQYCSCKMDSLCRVILNQLGPWIAMHM